MAHSTKIGYLPRNKVGKRGHSDKPIQHHIHVCLMIKYSAEGAQIQSKDTNTARVS
jgi:hypothetical protein